MARTLLVWAARRLDAVDLPGDADDLFADLAASDGRRAARRWYRRQTRAAVIRAVTLVGSPMGFRPRRPRLAGFGLDAKLGLRMLRRHPGISIVAGTTLAFAFVVGAGLFEFIRQTLPAPDLPLPSGARVVGLRYWDRTANEQRLPDRSDLDRWGRELRSVEYLGGFRTVVRNLFGGADAGRPVEVALMSPSGFQLAGTPPLAGRVLVDADLRSEAAPVAVLGAGLWRSRFGADPAVIGRTITVDDVDATVVGVMPAGFGFPVNHDLWMPLSSTTDPGGASVQTFGRLAPGATREALQAELSAFVERAGREQPDRYGSLAAQVLPYRESLFPRPLSLLLRALILQLNVYATLFLVLVAANIALLFFARAAAREREIVLRTALGAGRTRIVLQLFVEAMILCGGAAALGLAATGPGLAWVAGQIEHMGGGRPPFWFDARPSWATTIYVSVLALVASIVAGALPALKATGQVRHARLNQASAGGGGMRFGGVWTAVVITQIAATVVATAGAALMVRQARLSASVDTIFPAGEYLTAELAMDETLEPGVFAARLREVERLLAGTPGVAGLALADRLPLMPHPARLVEVEGLPGTSGSAGSSGLSVSVAAVSADFFPVFGATLLAGDGFGPSGGEDVVVDRFFVESVTGGLVTPGRRIRFVDGDQVGPWHRIAGVVESLETDRPGALHLDEPPRPFVYLPLMPGRAEHSVRVAIHAPGGPGHVAPALYEVAAAVSRDLRVSGVQTLDRVASGEVAFWRFWADLILLVSAVALVLSLAGVYAVTSFAVSRRTREIGVRVALGGPPIRVVAGIFRRPVGHVSIGVVIGCGLVAILVEMATGVFTLADGSRLLALGAVMLGVCGLACLHPALRALRVEPTRAIGEDG